jgi:GxxExxY protein
MTSTRESFHDAQTYELIGAAMEVHRELGCGYLETVYRAALALEFGLRGIDFCGEVPIPVRYKQRALPLGYRADFVCFGEVLVEVKALDGLGPREQAQVMNYLKGAGLRRALLLNFGVPSLQYRRFVRMLPRAMDPAPRRRD